MGNVADVLNPEERAVWCALLDAPIGVSLTVFELASDAAAASRQPIPEVVVTHLLRRLLHHGDATRTAVRRPRSRRRSFAYALTLPGREHGARLLADPSA